MSTDTESAIVITDEEAAHLTALEKDSQLGPVVKVLANITQVLQKALTFGTLKKSADEMQSDDSNKDDKSDKKKKKGDDDIDNDYSGENDDDIEETELNKSLSGKTDSADEQTAQYLASMFEEAVTEASDKTVAKLQKSFGVMLTKQRKDIQGDIQNAVKAEMGELTKALIARDETLQKSLDSAGREPVPNIMMRKPQYTVADKADAPKLDKDTVTSNLLKAMQEQRINLTLATEITNRVAAGQPLTPQMLKIASGL